MSLEFIETLYEKGLNSSRERSFWFAPACLALLAVVSMITPIVSIDTFALTSTLIILLAFGHVFVSHKWKQLLRPQDKTWKRNFIMTLTCLAATWGLSCALALTYFQTGWTSFVILLLTIALTTALAAALAPNFKLLSILVCLMLLPSGIAGIASVGGNRGVAIGSLCLFFTVLLILQGRLFHKQYWELIISKARLEAVMDAIPGTLSWVSSDLSYKGVNQHLAKLWHMEADSFVGKKLGHLDEKTELKDFVTRLFTSNDHQKDIEIKIKSGDTGKDKTYYFVATKYNKDKEAVLLGIDVTDYRKAIHESAQNTKG